MASALVSASALVKVFKRLYLLNIKMEVVHTCPDVRYLSEVLCYTIPTRMSALEVKVTDLEKKFLVKVFRDKERFREAMLSCNSSSLFLMKTCCMYSLKH